MLFQKPTQNSPLEIAEFCSNDMYDNVLEVAKRFIEEYGHCLIDLQLLPLRFLFTKHANTLKINHLMEPIFRHCRNLNTLRVRSKIISSVCDSSLLLPSLRYIDFTTCRLHPELLSVLSKNVPRSIKLTLGRCFLYDNEDETIKDRPVFNVHMPHTSVDTLYIDDDLDS
jgi:hypothetical protein